MEQNGLGVSTWLTLAIVMVVFFVLPGISLEIDRRRQLRRDRAAGPLTPMEPDR
jgi:hypothetical protein